METVDKIKKELINKIQSISNKDFLEALNTLISSKSTELKTEDLSNSQKAMLKMSENDVKNGRLISETAMAKRNLEWLNVI